MPRGRPKKNAATATLTTPMPVSTSANSITPATDNILEQAKGRFEVAVVVGLLPDGNIDVMTNNSNYAILQWLFSRASFELLNHEKMGYMNKAKEINPAKGEGA